MRILLVEDEENLAKALVQGLSKKGYAVDYITDGEKAMKRISLNHIDYDLVILDLMLPGMDGVAICEKMRKDLIMTPILVLTARDEVDVKVDLLLKGADDYIVKPFSFEELCARISALLRRPVESIQSTITYGDIVLDSSRHLVKKKDKKVPLTLKEFVLLEYFIRRPDVVVNREEILTHLWDFNYSSFSNVVDVHVKNLRKKLDLDNSPILLETVRGVGYRLTQ
ncbi:MAG: response regulator transcription factor [Parcubacteria group bacterium]